MLKQAYEQTLPPWKCFLRAQGVQCARLEAWGVTTVRDLGRGSVYGTIAMRDLINRGENGRPSHVCLRLRGCTLPIHHTSRASIPRRAGIADGVPEVLKSVRQQICRRSRRHQNVRFDRQRMDRM